LVVSAQAMALSNQIRLNKTNRTHGDNVLLCSEQSHTLVQTGSILPVYALLYN
jgi:hypothetical protein